MRRMAHLTPLDSRRRFRLQLVIQPGVIPSSVRKWRNWQTRKPQELVAARSWRFKSSLPHQPSLTLANVRVRYGWQARRRLSAVALAKADVHSRQPHSAPLYRDSLKKGERVSVSPSKSAYSWTCDAK